MNSYIIHVLLNILKTDDVVDTSIIDTATPEEIEILSSILMLYREHKLSNPEIIHAPTPTTSRHPAIVVGVGSRARHISNLLLTEMAVKIQQDNTPKKDSYDIDSLSFNLYDFSDLADFHIEPKTHFPRPNKHLNIKKPSQMKNNKINVVRQSVNRGK